MGSVVLDEVARGAPRSGSLLTSGAWTVFVGGAAEGPRAFGTEVVRFYDIAGSTPDELREAMDNHGPRSETGEPFDGWTAWSMTWRWRYAEQPKGCFLHQVAVEVDYITTLPRWRPPRGTDLSLIGRWRDFHRALVEHERGHRDQVQRVANQLVADLSGVRHAESYQHVDALGQVLGRQALDSARDAGVDFDCETDHGMIAGARWP